MRSPRLWRFALSKSGHFIDQSAAAPGQDGRAVGKARYCWLLLAESRLTRRLFGAMLQLIWALPVPTG